jgi:hypothetical protein
MSDLIETLRELHKKHQYLSAGNETYYGQAAAALESLQSENADLVRVLTDIAGELGCATDNEAILQSIAELRRQLEEARKDRREVLLDAASVFPVVLRKMWSGGDVVEWLCQEADRAAIKGERE